MKRLGIILLIGIAAFQVNAQRFKSNESNIKFFSKAPIEDIEAVNTEATSIIDVASKSFVFVVPIKGFSFKKKLMEEHFNENYLETEKYPKAIFKGKIEHWDGEKGDSEVVATGEMSIHGVEQQVSIEGIINYGDDTISITSVFPVVLQEYKIKIPKALFYNIAEVVEVSISFEYQPYVQN